MLVLGLALVALGVLARLWRASYRKISTTLAQDLLAKQPVPAVLKRLAFGLLRNKLGGLIWLTCLVVGGSLCALGLLVWASR